MAAYRYRAVVPASGEIRQGSASAADRDALVERLRVDGLAVIEVEELRAAEPGRSRRRGAAVKALPDAVGQLAVLLRAGLTLERALALTVENQRDPALARAIAGLRERVKSGLPLARAMAEADGLFDPTAIALAEAGEAGGDLAGALASLAETLERQAELRRTLNAALFYPAMLLVVALGVILLMMLVVIPQFETLFADLGGDLPPVTALVVGVSRFIREQGLWLLIGLVLAGFAASRLLALPAVRLALDRRILRLPVLGRLVAEAGTARFARTLSALVDGGVALPTALAIAGRTLGNRHMAAAVAPVAQRLGEGGGLAGPLAAAGVFPRLAIGFLRTGEETAQLAPMLARLADVLDREVRATTARLVGLMTPVITIVLGLLVAGIIAAIMSALLGINDLALQ
ncbi:type II secretion system F family protein [Zavarzinia compransoris]|uniref:type II secretion system F family protein n=1 Tax=Zavarzinia marina TaxID=2911065 RepID=UPI001F22DE01|nr:type II secretion system F family protein [Zavarzinia marina]MCF4164790.1 type II secretion system F family protein [Zavarzinia marina]